MKLIQITVTQTKTTVLCITVLSSLQATSSQARSANEGKKTMKLGIQ